MRRQGVLRGGDLTLENCLKEKFQLSGFRQGQREIISSILNGKDVLAVLPTGGGKSLCYQFPAVLSQKLVVVISPLIALMRDQVAAMKRIGVPSGCLHSGQTGDQKKEVFREMSAGGAYLLYLSPERAQKDGFKEWIKSRPLALFAVDEAHCVSQWGHDFREEYAQLDSLKTLRPDVPLLALTASATPHVLDDISRSLKLKSPQRHVHGFYRPNLYYQVESCADDNEKDHLLLQALKQTPEGRVIIYCGTRKVTEQIAENLETKFNGVGHYHAGLSAKTRTEVQEKYTQGEIRILVATNAFGMGIDQPDVRLVAHYQMPANIDSLYQEMGRAGRDGKDSTCLLLYSKKDKGLQSFFIQSSEAPAAIKSSRWRNLEALVDYCEGGECRHAEILTYYKDANRIASCGHCDSCLPNSSRRIVAPAPAPRVAAKTKLKKASHFLKPHVDKLDATQELRFQALRSWRKHKSVELDTPAFVIFSDKTLRDLAVKNPQSLDDLKNVYGLGEFKIEKFGWDVLAELKDV